MHARFSVRIAAPESEVARIRSVAEEIFDEIRRLESLLSRFVEDSDIARCNRLRRGESTIVSAETYRCLVAALEAHRLTSGHFDVAYLSQQPASVEAFRLLTRPFRVQSLVESLRLDLGGIGKGFALDVVAAILHDYGYSRAILGADTSTFLALDPPDDAEGWSVVIERGDAQETYLLSNSAISCSGKSFRGEHIFSVSRQDYATESDRAYVTAPTATLADALSTAAMTMNAENWRGCRQFFPLLSDCKIV
ncbi:MAG: FAD:protein FMN transferase [Thermoguttaceae bacterium]